SEVQQTTNDLKKTTTDIKEEAGKISQKLQSVESNVNGMNIGVRNYVIDGAREVIYQNNAVTDNKAESRKLSGDALNDFRGKQVYLSFDAETVNLEHGTASNNSVGIELRVGYADGKVSWFEACYNKIVPAGTNRYKRYSKISPKIEDKEIKDISMTVLNRSAKGTVKIKNIQAEIGTKETGFKNAIEDDVSITEFKQKTNEIIKTVEGTNEKISEVEQKQGNFEKQITEINKKATGIETNVKNLQETQTNQGKQITESNTQVKQLSDEMKLTMKKKDVEDYVGGLGTVNELRDADFK
ncbi:hypothetical protein CN469_31530, partial [Bacillus cereus]